MLTTRAECLVFWGNFAREHVLFCVLQGNIQFAHQGESVGVTNGDRLQSVAGMLHIDEKEFRQALVTRTVAARGEVMDKPLTETEVLYARDAFAKVGPLRIDGKNVNWRN